MLIDRDGNEVVRSQSFGVVQLVKNTESGELFFARVAVVPGENSEPGEPIRTAGAMSKFSLADLALRFGFPQPAVRQLLSSSGCEPIVDGTAEFWTEEALAVLREIPRTQVFVPPHAATITGQEHPGPRTCHGPAGEVWIDQ